MKKANNLKNSRISRIIRTVIIGAVTILLLFALLMAGVTPDQYDIHVGQPATKTIYATKDVEDTVTTQALRDAAANAVEPSYKSVDTSVNATVTANIQAMFDTLMQIRAEYANVEHIDDATLAEVNKISPVLLNKDTLGALLTGEESAVKAVFDASLSEMRDTLNSTLPEGQESASITRISRNLLSAEHSGALISLSTEVLRSCVQPNMLIDTEITEANRKKARDAVAPEMLVKREVIVREGEIVTEAQYQMISSLGLLASDNLDIPLFGGLLLVTLAVSLLMALYLWQFSPELLMDSKKMLLLCIIIVLQLSAALLVRDIHSYLMPVAMSAMLISMLLDHKTALYVNCMLSFMVSMLVSSDGLFSVSMFTVLLMSIAAGPIVTLILSRKQQRTGVLIAGFAIGVCNFLLSFSISLVSSANLRTSFIDSLWAVAGGALSALLAIGFQSLLELLFNVSSNAKLIELSNPNQPLLRRLLLEAPGTYHHSIIVANLAEAAATAVGGNGLLARVGAYYHDIGKLKRPMYFKENQMGDNPHDRTDPRVSAAILTAHPRDGAQMAQKARIPAPIVDIVRQHHGDSLALYFYDKAIKLYGENVDPSGFRYQGPRPHSKEAAIVMLADTIEAATRTLNNPSPEKMEQLIRKLVNEKMNDGQLNESALTFSDLDRICATFCTVLTGVFHERIEYPDMPLPPREEIKPLPEAEKAAEPAPEEAPTEDEGVRKIGAHAAKNTHAEEKESGH